MTFKRWQEKYPDALKATFKSKKYISIAAARQLLYGEGFTDAKLLESEDGKDSYTFIFSKQALNEL